MLFRSLETASFKEDISLISSEAEGYIKEISSLKDAVSKANEERDAAKRVMTAGKDAAVEVAKENDMLQGKVAKKDAYITQLKDWSKTLRAKILCPEAEEKGECSIEGCDWCHDVEPCRHHPNCSRTNCKFFHDPRQGKPKGNGAGQGKTGAAKTKITLMPEEDGGQGTKKGKEIKAGGKISLKAGKSKNEAKDVPKTLNLKVQAKSGVAQPNEMEGMSAKEKIMYLAKKSDEESTSQD